MRFDDAFRLLEDYGLTVGRVGEYGRRFIPCRDREGNDVLEATRDGVVRTPCFTDEEYEANDWEVRLP